MDGIVKLMVRVIIVTALALYAASLMFGLDVSLEWVFGVIIAAGVLEMSGMVVDVLKEKYSKEEP